MAKVAKTAGAVILGVLVFFAVGSILGLLIRALWPDYVAARETFAFTVPMLAARLGVGAVSIVIAGYAAAAIAPVRTSAAAITGGLLLLFFLPVHYKLLHSFPLWYHGFFLLTLIPLAMFGGSLARKR